MSTTFVVLIAVVGAVVFLGALAAIIIPMMRRLNRAQNDRAVDFRQGVFARGWNFEEYNDSYLMSVPPYWVNAKFLSENRAKKVKNIVTGNHRGWQFFAATFEMVREVQRDTNSYSPLGMRLPVRLPRLAVQRTTKLESRANKSIGLGDREFESERFNDNFDVSTDDEKFATDVLNARLMEYLMNDPLAQDRTFWIYEDWIYLSGTRRDLNEFVESLDFLAGVLERIPSFVLGGNR